MFPSIDLAPWGMVEAVAFLSGTRHQRPHCQQYPECAETLEERLQSPETVDGLAMTRRKNETCCLRGVLSYQREFYGELVQG